MKIVVKLPNQKLEDGFEIEEDYWQYMAYLAQLFSLVPFTEIKFFSVNHSQSEERFINEYKTFYKSKKCLGYLVSFFSFPFSLSSNHKPSDLCMYFDSDEIIEIHIPLLKSEEADELALSITENIYFEDEKDDFSDEDENENEEDEDDIPAYPFEYDFIKNKMIIRTIGWDVAELIVFFLLKQDYASNQMRFLHNIPESN